MFTYIIYQNQNELRTTKKTCFPESYAFFYSIPRLHQHREPFETPDALTTISVIFTECDRCLDYIPYHSVTALLQHNSIKGLNVKVRWEPVCRVLSFRYSDKLTRLHCDAVNTIKSIESQWVSSYLHACKLTL